ncbi:MULTISPECIES: hypothetical protein [Lactobacillus]|uniref:Uncharacterized protein n=1 Tax=Lactobacillus xujianguonis TaxID=2495899 RepID=A0A437SSL3_9LACO|nr:MULTISPECIES: hypothetical protein [Lactobacillus]RVU69936.1 hypothetical protein EJK17_10410 [Lactobacillus xujianguonis]RVU73463.1 hypothetical protein EJK20_08255 [Lactobacillus xujianguonis]
MTKHDDSSSQAELQAAAVIAVRNFKHAINAEFEAAFIARVIKYDKKKHLADLQPLVNLSDGQLRAQYLDVPVSYQCYILDEIFDRIKPDLAAVDFNSTIPAHPGAPAHHQTHFVDKLPKHRFMRPGIPVIAVTLDRDNDNWKGGRDASNFDPNTSRLHDANDSIVVGILGSDAVYG